MDQQPVTVEVFDSNSGQTVNLEIGKFDLQRAATGLLRGPSLMRLLPLCYKNMLEGDFLDLAPSILSSRSGNFRLFAMSTAMDAASGLSPERQERIAREARETLMGSAINFPFPEISEGLGVPDLGPEFRAPAKTDIPALFISGTLDGRTPETNAEEILPGFSNGVHMVIEGAGHSDPLFLSSPRIAEIMLDFMRGRPVADETIKLPPMDFRLQDSLVKVLSAIMLKEGVETGLQRYPELKASGKYILEEPEMNGLGYQLLRMGMTAEAIEIFKLNVAAFPDAFNTYDSLAEGYMEHGEKQLAVQNYEKSLELNPNNQNAVRMLKKLRASSKK